MAWRSPAQRRRERRRRSSGPTSFCSRAARRRSIFAGRSSACRTRLSLCCRAERAAAAYQEAAPDRRRGRRGLRVDRRERRGADRGRRRQPRGGLPVNVLTHCNAGWLATVDWGTALAPIFKAHRAGIPVHVWVDETRPRNQGASLTAWELDKDGVPHTVIADNTGGHLMQHGMVDLCIVGTDRTTRSRRRRQQDRHLSEGARGARQRRAVLCRASPPPPSTGASRDGVATFRSRSGAPRRSRI